MEFHVDLLIKLLFNLGLILLLIFLPFLANLTMISLTAEGDKVTHLGAFLLYGKAELLMPLPFPFIYILPILISFRILKSICLILLT